jgi:tRNA pseudouridine32 synthase / 23S rRNA pseudouridine746 synthase
MDTPELLYQDNTLVVVNKPAGLLAVPGRGEAGRVNLAAWLCERVPDALIVHRLDQATSGLMLFARGAHVQRQLSMAFAARQVAKRYVAVVHGSVPGEAGVIDAPLIVDWEHRPRQIVSLEHGKPSLTRWRMLARGAACSRLALTPITGRSHQLRVHLQSMGHPIVGDELYGPQPPRAKRLLLHACRLALLHPASGKPLVFESPTPAALFAIDYSENQLAAFDSPPCT